MLLISQLTRSFTEEDGTYIDSAMVRTSPFSAGSVGLIPGWAAKIPHASRPKNQKRNNSATDSIKTLKMVHVKLFFFLKNLLMNLTLEKNVVSLVIRFRLGSWPH